MAVEMKSIRPIGDGETGFPPAYDNRGYQRDAVVPVTDVEDVTPNDVKIDVDKHDNGITSYPPYTTSTDGNYNAYERTLVSLHTGLGSKWKTHKAVIKLGVGVMLALLYFAYFGYAMYYRFGDEGSWRLLVCTVLTVMLIAISMTYGQFHVQINRWWDGTQHARESRACMHLRTFIKCSLKLDKNMYTFGMGSIVGDLSSHRHDNEKDYRPYPVNLVEASRPHTMYPVKLEPGRLQYHQYSTESPYQPPRQLPELSYPPIHQLPGSAYQQTRQLPESYNLQRQLSESPEQSPSQLTELHSLFSQLPESPEHPHRQVSESPEQQSRQLPESPDQPANVITMKEECPDVTYAPTPSPTDSGIDSSFSPKYRVDSADDEQTLAKLSKMSEALVSPASQETVSHERPSHSFLALISMAIQSSPDRKLVLSDIYQYVMDNFPYYNNQQRAWRNSIRYNLSINDCFVKAGRSDRGNFWALNPAVAAEFATGDYSKRQSKRRRVKSFSGRPTVDRQNTPYATMSSTSTTYHPYSSATYRPRVYIPTPAPSTSGQPLTTSSVSPPVYLPKTEYTPNGGYSDYYPCYSSQTPSPPTTGYSTQPSPPGYNMAPTYDSASTVTSGLLMPVVKHERL